MGDAKAIVGEMHRELFGTGMHRVLDTFVRIPGV